MTTTEKQVRVFISRTFRDMHAERDHLVTVVFQNPSTSLRAGLLERGDADGLKNC